MDALTLYIDDNNDLWIFFADNNSSYIGGPFLYCIDNKTMKFKKDIRLFNDKGTPVASPFQPLFVSQDQIGNFLLVTDLAYLTKVDQYGQKIYRKRLMEYRNHWFNRSRERKNLISLGIFNGMEIMRKKRTDQGRLAASSCFLPPIQRPVI